MIILNLLMINHQPKYIGLDNVLPSRANGYGDSPIFLAPFLIGPCNIRCRKCDQKTQDYEHTMDERDIQGLVDDFAQLGGKSVLVFGHKEPLLSPHLDAVVDSSYRNGLSTVVFTNATRLDKDRARSLYERRTSLVISVDTFNKDTYDNLVINGDFEAMMSGIEAALSTEYNSNGDGQTRLAFNTVIMEPNLEEIPVLYQFAIERNIRFFLDTLYKCGEAEANWELLHVTEDRVREVLDPHGLFPPSEFFSHPDGCLVIKYGITVMPNGDIKPCPDSNVVIGNVMEESLSALRKKQIKRFSTCPSCIMDKS